MNIRKNYKTWKTTILLLMLSFRVYSQDTSRALPDGTEGVLFTYTGDTTAKFPPTMNPNDFDGRYSSFRIGLGYIHDYVAYSESETFRQQMDSAGFNLKPAFKLRDFRILGSGVLKTKRYIAWKFAYMWDGEFDQWLLRESGVTIGVPELSGHLFIGRTKEGYSMVKVMNGHSPWTAERQMAIDVIPILADGIKYFGYLPSSRIFWNLGAYNDIFSEGQKFSTFAWQYTALIGWMPFYHKEKNTLLHIAANYRYGKPLGGEISLKSRPESNPTPQLINTGVFSADYSTHIGGEIYYSNKSFMVGSEVMVHNFFSNDFDHHRFYGGDVVVSYFFTKAIRPYNTTGSIYGFIPVKKSVFKGGWGEWEAVLRFSLLNLNDRSISGGELWRLTPMINWYVSKVIRMEFAYGYSVLDRYGMKGAVQLFQSRIQFTIM
jgi:phosphate-selective porin OprO/OprP